VDEASKGSRDPQPQSQLLTSLLPPAPAASADEVVERLGLWERPPRRLAAAGPAAAGSARPYVLLNMVSSTDGRASAGGRSAPLSGPADRALFRALRTPVDAVLAGAGTVRSERYGRVLRDPERRAERRSRGMSEEPLACIATSRLALDPALPLLAEPAAKVVVLTGSAQELPSTAAAVSYVRAGTERMLDLPRALADLREQHGVELLLCEGGPHLAGELLAAGVLDELFLSLSPMLLGSPAGAGREPRILSGVELDPPVALELLSVLHSGSALFLRYRVAGSERVSRETMESSSLAS
jgi:riboflavin biosynthesis pyrimidine reductase